MNHQSLSIASPGAWPTSEYLQNGAGFSGATSTPLDVGVSSSTRYTAKAIARWSTVPFQTVDDEIIVSVCAFHGNGISKVAFSANGGAWLHINRMRANPETGVWEFWCRLRASDFPDGAIEIRAIAYPRVAGRCRVLQGLWEPTAGALTPIHGEYCLTLYANSGGTYDRTPKWVATTGNDTTGDGTEATPYLTIKKAVAAHVTQYGSAENCTVYCKAGTYVFETDYGSDYPVADSRYLTVAAAPGVTRADVILTFGRPRQGRLHIRGVTCMGDSAGDFYAGFVSKTTAVWVDDCLVTQIGGRYVGTSRQFSQCSYYATDSSWLDSYTGPISAIMARGVDVTTITADAFSGTQLCVNVTCTDADPGVTEAHTDIIQVFYADDYEYDNHIVYGLTALDVNAQCWFIAQLTVGIINNAAFVNMNMDSSAAFDTVGVASQFQKSADHCLLIGCTLNQRLVFTPTDGVYTNCLFLGNLFKEVLVDTGEVDNVTTIDWQSNHFVNTVGATHRTFGSDITTGAPAVANYSGLDFTPTAGGALTRRWANVHTPVDVNGDRRELTTSVGAIEQ